MSETPTVTINEGNIAILNGKTFRLLRAYSDRDEGWFFLALSSKMVLKEDDVAQHWQVIRAGNVYLALRTRVFSYHLIDGSEPPDGWPKLKAPGEFFAFVGPTESAVQEQLRLLLDNMPAMNYDHIFSRARWVGDDAGSDVRALVIRKSVLMKGE
jgi:hypothetical protein